MAEGWTKALHDGRVEAYSAGTRPSTVNCLAVKVMKEAGVDISSNYSKSLEEFRGLKFDFAVTLCGNAKEECPVFPGAKRTVHIGFPDPAAAKGSDEEVLAEFRRVRDMIRVFIERLPDSLDDQQSKEEGASE